MKWIRRLLNLYWWFVAATFLGSIWMGSEGEIQHYSVYVAGAQGLRLSVGGLLSNFVILFDRPTFLLVNGLAAECLFVVAWSLFGSDSRVSTAARKLISRSLGRNSG